MDARKQIDHFLKYLYTVKDTHRAVLIDDIKNDENLLRIAGSESELERILLKLKNDNYLLVYPEYPRLEDGRQDMSRGLLTYGSISFNGRLFHESGGYTKEIKSQRIMDLPKKYWYVAALLGVLSGFIIDIYKDNVKSFLNGKQPTVRQKDTLIIQLATDTLTLKKQGYYQLIHTKNAKPNP